MPEAAGDDVDGDAGLEQERGVDVPQVMEPDPGEGSRAVGESVVVGPDALARELGGEDG